MHRLKNLIAVILLAFGLTLTASSAMRPQETICADLSGPKIDRMAPFGLAQFTLSGDRNDIQFQFEAEVNGIGLADGAVLDVDLNGMFIGEITVDSHTGVLDLDTQFDDDVPIVLEGDKVTVSLGEAILVSGTF